MHAIRAAHAFDGTRFLPGGATVLVDGDRILAVETGWSALPDGVDVREYEGTVLPGLIDCHTHLVADATFGGLERVGTMTDEAIDEVIEDSLRAHARAGVTTVRDLGDRGYRTLAFRERLCLPRVVAAGPPLTTVGGHCGFLGGAVDGDPRAAVAERVERGVDVVKVMASGGFATPGPDTLGAQFTVAELAAMVDEAHRAGLPMGNDRSLHAAMPQPPPALAALMAAAGVTSFEQFYSSRIAVLARVRAHGVPVIAGVDSGMAPMKGHGNAWRTVGDLVDGGYALGEALAAATSLAATACGLQGQTGRLAAGYAADVLVVDGDLAQDPSLLGTPRMVLLRGTPVALV